MKMVRLEKYATVILGWHEEPVYKILGFHGCDSGVWRRVAL
jgi:hypothetical protein